MKIRMSLRYGALFQAHQVGPEVRSPMEYSEEKGTTSSIRFQISRVSALNSSGQHVRYLIPVCLTQLYVLVIANPTSILRTPSACLHTNPLSHFFADFAAWESSENRR